MGHAEYTGQEFIEKRWHLARFLTSLVSVTFFTKQHAPSVRCAFLVDKHIFVTDDNPKHFFAIGISSS